MAFIDGTVVNVALPALQQAFDAGIAQVQWLVESSALLLTALLLGQRDRLDAIELLASQPSANGK